MVRNLLLLASVALIVLAGCGEKASDTVSPPAPEKGTVLPIKKGEPVPSQAAPEPLPPPYVYDPSGRRDPFESLLAIKKPIESEEAVLTPLQKFDIERLRLIGVIIGKGEPKAMIIAPDGKSYILKKGIKVGRNDGTVVQINRDGVLVEEHYIDFSGEVRTGIQEIMLPKREGVE